MSFGAEIAADSGTASRYAPPPMTTEKDVVSVERVIPAPPERIFDLLADPERHPEIDGSGTVKRTRGGGSERLKLGSRFGMSMRAGVPYAMESHVVEFDEPRRIAWQTRGPTRFGRMFGGRIWRYELEPADSGTLVRESWDISQESALTRPGIRMMASTTKKNMEATLERIEKLTAG